MDTVVNVILKTQGDGNLRKINQELNKTDNVIRKTNGQLGRASKGFRGMGAAAGRASGGFKALGASITAALGPIIGVTSALAGLQKAISTAFERDAAENRLKNLAKTTGDYEYALAAAREASEKFGFTLTDATKLFGDAQARIGTLGYNVEQVNEIFTGFNVVARQAGVSSEDAAGAFTQLAQGMAAGTLQGDELRSILERMPAVTKLLADEMGVPVEQIKKLGSEGKITSDIIYRALSTAAEGADELGNKLTPTQKAFMELKKSVENAFNTIGQLLEPVIVPATKAASAATQALSDVWEYIAGTIFPRVAAAFQPLIDAFQRLFADFDWNALGGLITNAIVKPFEVMTSVVEGVVPIITWIVNRLADLANTPLIQGLLRAVNGLLDKLGLLKNPVAEFKAKVDESKKSTDDLKGGISKAKEGTEGAAEAAENLSNQFKTAASEALAAAEASQQVLKDNQALYQAEYDLNSAILGIQKEQGQELLKNAKNMDEVVKAANMIYEATVEQAKLDRELMKAKADAAVEELSLKERLIEATIKQAEGERAILVAKGESTKEIDKQINKTREGLKVLQGSIQIQEKIRDKQYQQADALYKQAVRAAQLAKEGNIRAGREKSITKEIQQQNNLLDQQARKAAAANAARQGGGSGGSSGTTTRSWSTQLPKEFMEAIRPKIAFKSLYQMQQFYKDYDKHVKDANQLMQKQKRYNELANKATEYAEAGAREAASIFSTAARKLWSEMPRGFKDSTQLPKYGSGGYVNGAQTAVIGEAGPEYVIRADRMDQVLANYASGKRGNAVFSQQVNVTTGPVQQMDGTNYVTLQQATSMSQSAARQGAQMALTQIKTDPGTRRAIGVGS